MAEKGNHQIKKIIPEDYIEAISYVREFGLPVQIIASFVVGGWMRTATNEREVKDFVEEGQLRSPTNEVVMRWQIS